MKIKSLYMFGLMAAAAAFTACDDAKEPTYTPAAPIDTPTDAAYFDASEKSSFVVGETDTEVTYSVSRAKAGEAATVSLSSAVTFKDEAGAEVDASNLFTIPTTATFAADALSAPIEISFVATDLLPNVPYTIKLTVGDGLETPYFSQVSSVTMRFAPWNDVLGPNGETVAILYDGFLNGVGSIGEFYNECKIQSSPAIKGLYRVVNPYQPGNPAPYILPADENYEGNYYMYFNASNPAKVFICDENGNAKTEDGTVALFNTGVQINFTAGPSTAIYGTGQATLQLARGKTEEAEPYYGKLSNGILTFPGDQSLLVTTQEDLETTGNLYVGKNAMFKLVFPGANAEGSWAELGEAMFTDGVIAPMFGISETAETYAVPVEQSEDNPALYRLVNPYKEGICPYGVAYDGDIHIIIDCTNPQCVFVKQQETGVVDENDGPVTILNYAYNASGRYSEDEIIANGWNDVFADGKITFGLGIGQSAESYSHIVVNFPESHNTDSNSGKPVSNILYFTEQATVIELPGTAASAPAKRMTVKNSPLNTSRKHYVDHFEAIVSNSNVLLRKNLTPVSL